MTVLRLSMGRFRTKELQMHGQRGTCDAAQSPEQVKTLSKSK